jgi:Protein of unknown function (DUF3108)
MKSEYWIFLLATLFFFQSDLFSQNRLPHFTHPVSGKTIQLGEDFTYIVKYAFFNLGEVRIKVVDKESLRNVPVLKTVATMDSYEDLPFVELHQVYESFIDSTFFPQKFIGTINDEDTTITVYDFISDSVHILRKFKKSKKYFLDSTASVSKKMQDGLSILFYSRVNFNNKQEITIPCFVNEKEEKAEIRYYPENEPVSVDAVDYEIDCKRLEGETDFVSVYGLTGHFEGWFSNDESSIPIVAKLNVIIGSVTLELIDWNKKLWNPPVYKN